MKITFKHGNNTATQIAVEDPEDLTLERLTFHLQKGRLDTVEPAVTRKLLEHIRSLDGFSRNADLKVDLSGSPLKWSSNSSSEVSAKRRGITDPEPPKPVRKKRRTQPGPSFLNAPEMELVMADTQQPEHPLKVSEEYRNLCKRIAMNDGDLPSLKASRARYIIRDLFNGRSLLHREGLKIARIGGSVEPSDLTSKLRLHVTTKDLWSRPTEFHMNHALQPATEAPFVEQIAQIAEAEEKTLVMSVPHHTYEGALESVGQLPQRGRVKVVSVKEDQLGLWAEDSGQLMANGEALFISHADLDPTRYIMERRRARDYPRWRSTGLGVKLNPGMVGSKVAVDGHAHEKRGLAKAMGAKARPMDSFIEGGQVLFGRNQLGEPFVLVGRDAVEATRYSLSMREDSEELASALGVNLKFEGLDVEPEEISDEFIKKVIGRDFGVVDLDSIYFVDQPGTFHLDLGMALLGEGVVVLNDSGLVQENLLKWLHEDRALIKTKLAQSPEYSDALSLELDEVMLEMDGHIRQYCDQMRVYEARTLEDLMKVDNLVIKRVAGFYPATLNSPCMNFLNGEIGLGRGERGFFVTNGGSSRGEDAFVDSLEALNDSYPGPLQRLYFMDPCLSGGTLRSMGGGVGCRLNTATDFYNV